MKALKPTLAVQGLFLVLFNVFMVLILEAVNVEIHLKLLAAINFSALLILLNWLPKTMNQMDERERFILMQGQHRCLNLFFVLITLVFSIHLTVYPQLSVIDFVILTGLPTTLFMSWQNVKLRREMI